MKLKLNRTLRAALIAAITTAGFTFTQAEAKSWNGGANIDTNWFYTNNGGVDRTLVDTEDGTINLTAEGNGAAGVTASIASITAKDGGTLRIVGGNTWGPTDRFFKDLTIDTLKAGENGEGEVFINTQQYNGNCGPDRATAALKHVQGTLTGVDNYAFLTLGTEGGTIAASGTLENLRNDATLTLKGTYTFNTTDATKYTVKKEGDVTWSDTANSQGFKKTTGSTFYAIKGAAEGTGFSVTTSSGPEVSKDEEGNYYFTAGDVTDTSKFYVKAATATLEGVNATGQIVVEHAGATVTVQNATFRDTSGSKNLNVVINDGGVLETTHSGGNGCVTGDIIINGGGTFRVAGQHDAFGWGSGTTKNIILQGEEGKVATLDFQQTTTNSATFNAALKLKGYTAITGAKGFNTHDGSFYAEGVENSIESFQIRHAATFEVKEGGQLTVGTMTKGQDGNKTLTKTGKGTMTFTTKAQAAGLVINEGEIVISGGAENSFNALTIGENGTMKVTGGTTAVSGAGNVLSNTIAVTGGTLTLSGTYEIGGNSGSMTTDYVGGEVQGNGFEHVAGSSTVYTKAEGATVNIEGATFTVGGQSVTLEDGVYTTEGSTNFGTFYVKSGTESLAHALQYAQGATVSNVSLANGTTINTDSDGTSIGLVLASGVSSATVNATAATTLSSISGWSGNKLTIAGTSTVTSPGAILLDEAGDALEVAAGTILAITGRNNLTVQHGVATVNGTVTIGHEIDLSKGSTSDGKLSIGSTGSVTAADGMWMATTAVGVLLEEGGTLTITGKGVSFTGKEGVGSITAQNAEVNYSTTDANAVISNIVMTATKDITISNTLSNVDVVTGAHAVTLNSDADAVIVKEGGTINKGDGVTISDLTVEDGGTIGEGIVATEAKIAKDATIFVEEGISDLDADVYVYSFVGDTTVTNLGNDVAKYEGLQDSNMKVSADTLSAANEDAYVVNNELEVGVIMHEGKGALTLTKVDEDALKVVSTDSADLTIKGITETSLTDLSIGTGATVAVYTDATAEVEGTVTINDTLTAGGGTLLANLTIEASEGDAFQWDLGGTTMTLGSTLKLVTADGLIQLDDETMQNIADLQAHESYELVLDRAGDLTYIGEGWWDQVFTRSYGEGNGLVLTGDYQVGLLDNGNFGVTKLSNVPEPTTGTLSLLALAGLCARRRRK